MSVPTYDVVGVYVNVPSEFNVKEPCKGAVIGVVFTVIVFPSGSESLVKTFPDKVTFISVE